MEVREVDGYFELTEEPTDPKLSNRDLAPTPVKLRNWGYYEYIAIWVGMSICVPTWLLGSSFIAAGFSWRVAIGTIALGNIIVLIPMVLNSFPGARYGIPFPVILRSSFGVYGANIPAIMRAVVACGWFGIQTWIGGSAIDGILGVLSEGWKVVPGHIWISFVIFWIINIWVSWAAPPWKGSRAIKIMNDTASPVLILIGVGLLAWAVGEAGGWGPILAQETTVADFWGLWPAFLVGMVAYWSTLALNMPDLTRFAKNQRVQVVGQSIGLPVTMTAFAFLGVATTSASVLIYGEAVWDPIDLILRTGNVLAEIVALIFIVLATTTTNVTANVVAPANDFANVAPKYIDFQRGALLTGIIGIAIQPWRLLETYGAYIFTWLGTYSAFLGPIAGVMIADYWICRRQFFRLDDLYKSDGIYRFYGGVNPAGIVALIIGIAVALLPQMVNWRWFIGIIVALVVYTILFKVWLEPRSGYVVTQAQYDEANQ
jgi:NCS1 family nucleobase:cation symporter-1